MEETLYDKKGDTVAYIATDYHGAIFLWDGQPVAYLYEEDHLYGINGRHLGWFINEIIYDQEGARIGFTSSTWFRYLDMSRMTARPTDWPDSAVPAPRGRMGTP